LAALKILDPWPSVLKPPTWMGRKNMKILLADDEPIARTMLEHWVSGWGYQIVSVKDGQSALEALRADQAIRIAVLDWVMPKLDGVDICRQVRELRQEPYVCFLLLTARDDKNDILRGLDAGADDYLIKPCNPFELRVRLRAAVRLVEVHDGLAAARKELATKATTDPLTGALNRGPALEFLKKELARSERSSVATSIVVVHMDQVAQVVDERGGEIGDRMLEEAARRFLSVVRNYDLFSRTGVGEFLFVLPQCDADHAVEVAARLQYALSGTPATIGLQTLRVTASYGVASTSQRPGARLEQLLCSAEHAARRARSEGRNRVRLALPEEWLDSEKCVSARSVPAA
jgi:two-component system, cell cycle response regulator